MSENELPICTACGSQFDAEASSPPDHCKICDVGIHTQERERGTIFSLDMLTESNVGSSPVRPIVRAVLDYAE